MVDTSMPQERTVLRRQPKQERSRERVDEILKVTMQLIGEKGIDAVTMKAVADRSGGPIASIYQYFPNKSAIISTLYERYSMNLRALLQESLGNIRSVDDVMLAVDDILGKYYALIQADPSIRDLLNAIEADKTLQHMDIVETRLQAAMFTAATVAFIPEHVRERYARTTFLMFHLSGSTVSLAHMLDGEEAVLMLEDYRAIIKGQLQLFIEARR
ncbi:TetR family transcriptional regulator [Rhizobiaceae bacterium n13]|uniref:TetR family transcriptional regulator n=1 Tax=Ferirhizobium litorale TaxID=2927786 RepID=A0AAE3U212_9HYPH|nr:TetR/AcrR family transcriptional regulator [Fererhizobium litorale]MDI7863481.1 TetR family transcriptional regulator [Fererhizobium litorale]MDI7922242.1 TetR family transcriptional regulator [Fererhizobium litorale]